MLNKILKKYNNKIKNIFSRLYKIGDIWKGVLSFNKALEINSYYLRLGLNEENTRKAKNANILVLINADSHRSNNLDIMRFGVDIARRADIEKESVINTLSLKELKKWKSSR